jgi:hypothetical protein
MPALLRLAVLLLCVSGASALCVNIVPYPARNMTAVSCPNNAFVCTANDVNVDTVAATVLPGQFCQCNPGSCQGSYVNVLFVVYVDATASTR